MVDTLGQTQAGYADEMGHSEQVLLRLPATPRSAAAVRAAAREWCERQGAPDRLDQVSLAVTEAVANTVLHAYPDGGGGDIVVSLEIDDDGGLEVSVRDFGVGMRSPDPAQQHFGVRLIHELADSADITDADPGTLVVMRFGSGSRAAARV